MRTPQVHPRPVRRGVPAVVAPATPDPDDVATGPDAERLVSRLLDS